MKKVLSLVSLSLVLAACSGGGLDPTAIGGRASVSVTVDNSTVGLDAAGTGDAATNVTFKSAPGSLGVTVKQAVISFPGTTLKAVTVDLSQLDVPSGFTCPNAAGVNSLYFCGLQEQGSSSGERTVTKQYKNSDLFQKAIQVNSSARTFALQFTGTVYNSSANWTSNAVTFNYNPGQNTGNPGTQAPTPTLVVNNTDVQPYSGILSLTASGGFAAGAQVQQLTLEIVDSRGIVDNTTYTSTQPTQTFSVDTAKYPDGNLTLRVIATTKDSLSGASSATTVQIRNLVAPKMQIVSPTSGQSVSTQLNASVQLLKQNTNFTILGPNGSTPNQVKFNIKDYRGSVVASKTSTFAQSNTGLFIATTSFDMNGALFPNNVYTLETLTQVQLTGESAPRILTSETQFQTQNSNNRPPAVILHLPTSLGNSLQTIVGRRGGAFVQMTDDDGIKQLQMQLTCVSAACDGFGSYAYNYPISGSTVVFSFVDLGLVLDGQPYVKDGDYILRVTATDGTGNTNIQEVPVTVSRAASADTIADLGVVNTTTTADPSGKLNFSSATWDLSGINANPVRVASMYYDKSTATIGVSAPTRMNVDYLPAGTPISGSIGFAEPGNYQVCFLVEDLVTGVVRYYRGEIIVVKKLD